MSSLTPVPAVTPVTPVTPAPAESQPTPALPPLAQRRALRVARLPVGWALVLLAAVSAALAGALALGLAEGLGWPAGAAAPLAAVLALLATALPVAVLVFKSNPAAPTPDERSQVLDSSTGAATKTLFLDLAEREWARARRYGTGAALLLIDVDRYPRLCDSHGSAAGDAVLRELTRQTAPTLRGADAIARFNPSQLAVFLAQADPTGALDVAERIRERAEHLEVAFHPQRLRIAVSVGVAQLRPAHLNLQALIRDAEDAVLAARQAGGNCVRAAPLDAGRQEAPGAPRNDHRARPQ